MGHQIEEFDVQEGIEMAWHGLTQVKPSLTMDDCWLSKWDVSPTPLYRKGTDEDGKETDIESGFSVLRCNDVDLQIGFPFDPKTYSVVNNAALREMIKKALGGTKHKIVSVGSLQNRNKVFVSIKLEQLEAFKVAGREFEAYLNFGNGLADRSAFWVNTSNICTVCANTYGMNLTHKGKTLDVRIRHSKNMIDEIENLPQVIDAAVGVQAEFAQALSGLSKVAATAIKAERVFTGFLTDERDLTKALADKSRARQSDVISTRSKNTVNRLVDLFNGEGKGNRGKDFVDVFSAATDYFTHESSGGENRRKQFESSEFGAGLRKKQEFFELIVDKDSRGELEERGAKVMELPVVE